MIAKRFRKNFLLLYTLVVVFISLTLRSYSQDRDLIGYWAFDDNRGDTTKDSSENGNDGTIHNAQWVKGKLSSALEFNGSDAYVEIAHNDSFDFTDAKGLTIGAWIQPDGAQPAWAKIMCEERFDNPTYPWSFGYNDKNEIRGTAAGGTIVVIPNVSGWHYVAVIVDVPNNKIMLYQDGKIAQEKVGLSGKLTTYGNPVSIGVKKISPLPKSAPFLHTQPRLSNSEKYPLNSNHLLHCSGVILLLSRQQ